MFQAPLSRAYLFTISRQALLGSKLFFASKLVLQQVFATRIPGGLTPP